MPRFATPALVLAGALLGTGCGAASAAHVAAPTSAVATLTTAPTTAAPTSAGTTSLQPVSAPSTPPTQTPTRTEDPKLDVGSCKVLTAAQAIALLGPVYANPIITGDDAATCTRWSTDVNGGEVQFGKDNAASLSSVTSAFTKAMSGPNTGGATGTVTHVSGLGSGAVLLTEHVPGRLPTYTIDWLQGGHVYNLDVVHAKNGTPATALHLAHVLAATAG